MDYYFTIGKYLLACDFDSLTLISFGRSKCYPCSEEHEPNACLMSILGMLAQGFDLHDEFSLKAINLIKTL